MIARTKEQKRNRVARWYYFSLGVFLGICCVILVAFGEKGFGVGAGAGALGTLAIHTVYYHEHKYHGE